MKLLILCILSLFTVVSYGQTVNTTTVVLSASDGRGNELNSWEVIFDTMYLYQLPEEVSGYMFTPGRLERENSWPINTILIHKIPEDTLISTLFNAATEDPFPIRFENVPVGNYKLIYKNKFHQSVVTEIILKPQPTNSIVLFPGTLTDYSQNTLSKLKNKDTISIKYELMACFDDKVEELIIIKSKGKLIAKLYTYPVIYDIEKEMDVYDYANKLLLKSTTMTTENIRELIRFENELNFEFDNGCTTRNTYIVKSKYWNIEKEDASCRWGGYYYLRESLFGKME